jgi:hypothetical protein
VGRDGRARAIGRKSNVPDPKGTVDRERYKCVGMLLLVIDVVVVVPDVVSVNGDIVVACSCCSCC